MDELSAKMVVYKVVAESTYKRKGITRMCSRCGRDFSGPIDPTASHIICHLCAMGLADGVFVPKVKQQRNKRVGEIDVERRLLNGKSSNNS